MRKRSLRFAWCGWLCASICVACAPYSVMDFHREVLDRQARARFDCEQGSLEVTDETPEGFRYGRDPQAARYRVQACEQEDVYVCYQIPEANVGSPAPECRRLGEEPAIIHLGPIPL